MGAWLNAQNVNVQAKNAVSESLYLILIYNIYKGLGQRFLPWAPTGGRFQQLGGGYVTEQNGGCLEILVGDKSLKRYSIYATLKKIVKGDMRKPVRKTGAKWESLGHIPR